MDKIKHFINIHVPVTTCTLRCHYCYITHHRLFGGKLPDFPYSPEHVRKALSKERFGGVCLVNICGEGETLLPPSIIGYIKSLLEEGHYVMVVTNGTLSKRFMQISEFSENILKRLFFKFSYHYLEFKEKNLLERFFDNVKMMQNRGCSFTIEVTPSDELIPFIDEMNEYTIKQVGAIPHITIGRDERVEGELPILTDMSDEEYYKTWSKQESSFFNYKKTIYGIKRKEFCYAGAWASQINLKTGIMSQCYKSNYRQNIFEDIEKPIKFMPIGNCCKEEHCYNGHAFLVLGLIPELKSPTYEEIRNKQCVDGTEWLKPEMKSFMSTKLTETNKEFNRFKKTLSNAKNLFWDGIAKGYRLINR